ncbi:MAG: RNA polymerase sigma factor [Methanobacteriota archaeon]|nr:MAG: RNA polymerase sigma factor [Euryarchaeota archaeon]
MMDQKERFHTILKDYGDKIFRVCRSYLYEAHLIDDLYQEVLVNIWRSLKNFRGESNPGTYVYRVTVNTIITFNRKEKHRKSLFVDALPENILHEHSEESPSELIEQLTRAISRLPADERIIIGLYLEELSYKDIADVIGTNTNHVGVKINRIKKKLSKMMEEYHGL